MALLGAYIKRQVKIHLLNVLDFLLENQKLNAVIEKICIYLPRPDLLSRMLTRPICFLSSLLMSKTIRIGIVLDGNRRFAQMKGLPVTEGHKEGGKNAIAVVNHLLDIGCSSIALFVWSKKNFNRPKEEVTKIMNICCDLFNRIKKNEEINEGHKKLFSKCMCIGDTTLLAPKVQEIVKEINKGEVKDKSLFFLFSYSSLDEYLLSKSDGIPVPVDIIIRTGGENRLSDFLLCNASKNAMVCFLAAKWPLVTRLHIYLVLLKYRIEQSLINS